MTDPPPATFEAHLTVSPASAGGRVAWAGRFGEACGGLGLKPLLIEAPGAAAPLQPMASAFLHGSLLAAKERLAALAEALGQRGFPPTRLKLEAVGRQNPYLPERASDLEWGPARYFEFHVKARLADAAEVARLGALCVRQGAHLSRNPRRSTPGGATERFVTLRLRELGKREAAARHATLCRALTEAGFRISPGAIEFAVLDTRVELDAGWAS